MQLHKPVFEIYCVTGAAAASKAALPDSGSPRQDILRPKIRLKDSASGETLCTYALEEQPLEERQRCTSVVMCRMFREESGPKCALNSDFGLCAAPSALSTLAWDGVPCCALCREQSCVLHFACQCTAHIKQLTQAASS